MPMEVCSFLWFEFCDLIGFMLKLITIVVILKLRPMIKSGPSSVLKNGINALREEALGLHDLAITSAL
jgi:hypothetical protein